MDSSPTDTVTTRGGDGSLDNFDLIATLRRVVSLDLTKPRRPSRGLTCPDAEPLRARPVPEFSLGTAQAAPGGAFRVPVYWRSTSEQDLAGFSFGLGVAGEATPLRFVPGEIAAPTVTDGNLTGSLSAAWLEGLKLPAGRRILLGYVEIPTGGRRAAESLTVHGVVTNAK